MRVSSGVCILLGSHVASLLVSGHSGLILLIYKDIFPRVFKDFLIYVNNKKLFLGSFILFYLEKLLFIIFNFKIIYFFTIHFK